jgi:ectoine hydroxylase-related dioxygenase (phytanoyl-CoA dioxygenase family)
LSLSIERFPAANYAELKAYYDTHGFVIVNRVFPEGVLEEFLAEYKSLVEINIRKSKVNCTLNHTDENFISEGIKLLESVNHSWVADIYDTSAMLPSFLNIISNSETQKIIKYLLGITGPIYPYTNRTRIDPPSDNRRTYGWHQETFYTIPRSSFIQTWAPLIYNVREENGTIFVADKSHNEGIPFQTWEEIPGKATQILIPEDTVEKYEQIPIEMNVGELLFFSGRLAHKSGNNISKRVRFSLVGMYHDISNIEFVAPSIDFLHKHGDPRTYFDTEMRRIKG